MRDLVFDNVGHAITREKTLVCFNGAEGWPPLLKVIVIISNYEKISFARTNTT